MKKNETRKAKKKTVDEELNDPKRRSFLKKLGMGVILASTYSVVSMTQFGCVHDPEDDMVPRGGY